MQQHSLLATKLYILPIRPKLVSRPRSARANRRSVAFADRPEARLVLQAPRGGSIRIPWAA